MEPLLLKGEMYAVGCCHISLIVDLKYLFGGVFQKATKIKITDLKWIKCDYETSNRRFFFSFFAMLGSATTLHSLTHCLLSPCYSRPDPVPPLHLSSTCSPLQFMSSHDPLPYCLKAGIYGLQYLSEN